MTGAVVIVVAVSLAQSALMGGGAVSDVLEVRILTSSVAFCGGASGGGRIVNVVGIVAIIPREYTGALASRHRIVSVPHRTLEMIPAVRIVIAVSAALIAFVVLGAFLAVDLVQFRTMIDGRVVRNPTRRIIPPRDVTQCRVHVLAVLGMMFGTEATFLLGIVRLVGVQFERMVRIEHIIPGVARQQLGGIGVIQGPETIRSFAVRRHDQRFPPARPTVRTSRRTDES